MGLNYFIYNTLYNCMTPEIFERKLRHLERRVCCLLQAGGGDSGLGPCEYDGNIPFSDFVEGMAYGINLYYNDLSGNIDVIIIQATSDGTQTPQEFIDTLNVTYNPNIVFTLVDGTVHVVAQDFGAACFLIVEATENLPNAEFTYDSPNQINFTSITAISDTGITQGVYPGDWGIDNLTEVGYVPFDSSTDILRFAYSASLPSPTSLCLVLDNDSFNLSTNLNFSSGTGNVEITGLAGMLNNSFTLFITADSSC